MTWCLWKCSPCRPGEALRKTAAANGPAPVGPRSGAGRSIAAADLDQQTLPRRNGLVTHLQDSGRRASSSPDPRTEPCGDLRRQVPERITGFHVYPHLVRSLTGRICQQQELRAPLQTTQVPGATGKREAVHGAAKHLGRRGCEFDGSLSGIHLVGLPLSVRKGASCVRPVSYEVPGSGETDGACGTRSCPQDTRMPGERAISARPATHSLIACHAAES